MIVGRGNIARALTPRDGAIFFCSGVSNSSLPKGDVEFRIEREKLVRFHGTPDSMFYFSSIDTDRKQTPYYDHKLEMEGIVRTFFRNYNILRIGNLEGDTNPNTFINYLRAKREAGKSFIIWDEYKYMITPKDLNMLCQSLPLTGRNIINAFSYMAKVADLIK